MSLVQIHLVDPLVKSWTTRPSVNEVRDGEGMLVCQLTLNKRLRSRNGSLHQVYYTLQQLWWRGGGGGGEVVMLSETEGGFHFVGELYTILTHI